MVDVKKWRRAVSLGFILALGLAPALAGPASAQDPKKNPPPTTREDGSPDDGETTGARGRSMGRFLIGDPAPDLQLNDADGRSFRLAVERRTQPWLLVFVRRPGEVADIAAAAGELKELGLGTAIIAPFGPTRVPGLGAATHHRLLFDRASMTARTFGVFDPVTSNPRPGAFLVDQRGRFVWMISGGLPSASELVRMTREAMEAQAAAQADAQAGQK